MPFKYIIQKPVTFIHVVVMFKNRYDHLVAIERSGRAADGNYYNMRGVNIKHLVDPIDNLFIAAKGIPGIITTGRLRLLQVVGCITSFVLPF